MNDFMDGVNAVEEEMPLGYDLRALIRDLLQHALVEILDTKIGLQNKKRYFFAVIFSDTLVLV
jgi:hypothetical protein